MAKRASMTPSRSSSLPSRDRLAWVKLAVDGRISMGPPRICFTKPNSACPLPSSNSGPNSPRRRSSPTMRSKRKVQPPGRGVGFGISVAARSTPPLKPVACTRGKRNSLRNSGSTLIWPLACSACSDHALRRTWPRSFTSETETRPGHHVLPPAQWIWNFSGLRLTAHGPSEVLRNTLPATRYNAYAPATANNARHAQRPYLCDA